MKKRYLLIGAVALAGFGIIQMTLNRSHAVELAQKIIAKDNTGADTTTDIAVLSSYVHSHMRTGVNFTLEGSYNRAVQAAEQAATGGSANAGVYAAASAACTNKNPVTTANCITAYVQTHAAPGAKPQPLVLPDRNPFVYQLAAPGWALDMPGLAFLASVVLLALVLYLQVFKLLKRPSY